MASSSSSANVSHGIGCNDEIEQLVSLQRAGLLSAADFTRMAAEILKTDSERLRQAPPDAPHDSSSPGERAPSLDPNSPSTGRSESPLVDESGNLFTGDAVSLSPAASFDDTPPDDMGTPPRSPLDAEGEAQPTAAEECIKAGAKMLYGEHEVTVVRIGVESDHFNNGRVRITWEQVKNGCTRKKETLTKWVGPNELRHKPQPVEGGAPSPAVQSPTTRAMAAAETARAEQRAAQRQAAEDALPERAAHERQRQMSQKAPAASRRYSDVYKTKESKVPLEKRLEQFKDHTLVITNGPDGKKLFCRACKHTFHNVWRCAASPQLPLHPLTLLCSMHVLPPYRLAPSDLSP
jgi:hypothetical protein